MLIEMFKIIKNVKNNIKTLKEVIILFFFYLSLGLLIILTILIVFTTIQIHIENIRLEIPKKNERNINKKYKITIKLYIFEKINYFKLDITKYKMEKRVIRKNIEKLKRKIEKDKNNFDMKQISKLKKMNIKIQKINLKMVLGTEDAAQNAIIVGTISSIIAIIMGALSEKKILAIGDGKENQINWKIIPLYQNRNLLNIDLNCIISFKLIHIINAI